MRKLFLVETLNTDQCFVVELPNPFIVEVAYDDEMQMMDIMLSDRETPIESYTYKYRLYVKPEHQNFASYADIHTIFTDFRKEVVRFVTNDIIHYLRTGFYFDEDEEDFYEDETHEFFDLNYYSERWEEFVNDFLKSEEPKYTYKNHSQVSNSDEESVNESEDTNV